MVWHFPVKEDGSAIVRSGKEAWTVKTGDRKKPVGREETEDAKFA